MGFYNCFRGGFVCFDRRQRRRNFFLIPLIPVVEFFGDSSDSASENLVIPLIPRAENF
jgi:hypothetical protein